LEQGHRGEVVKLAGLGGSKNRRKGEKEKKRGKCLGKNRKKRD